MKHQNAGFSLVELLIVVLVIGIIAAIAIPNLISTRRAANEASAIAAVRTILSSQSSFQSSMGNGNYADLPQLGNAGLIDTILGCSTSSCTKSGYYFTVTPTDRVEGGDPAFFDATAVPQVFSSGWSGTGSRSFYSNEVGIIFYTISITPPSGTDASNRRPTTGAEITM